MHLSTTIKTILIRASNFTYSFNFLLTLLASLQTWQSLESSQQSSVCSAITILSTSLSKLDRSLPCPYFGSTDAPRGTVNHSRCRLVSVQCNRWRWYGSFNSGAKFECSCATTILNGMEHKKSVYTPGPKMLHFYGEMQPWNDFTIIRFIFVVFCHHSGVLPSQWCFAITVVCLDSAITVAGLLTLPSQWQACWLQFYVMSSTIL